MKIHIFQHISVKQPGAVLDWITKNKLDYQIHLIKNGDALPTLEETDFLIILGGALHINDEEEHPWLRPDINFVRKIIDLNKPVLGICLGAQIIARALDFKVEKNEYREIGWHNVMLNNNAKQNHFFKDIPHKFIPLHWHSDIIRLPENISSLVYSNATDSQAFTYKNTISVQFHIEQTEKTLDIMLEKANDYLIKDKFVQTADEIRLGYNNLIDSNNILFHLLDSLMEII